MVGVKIGDIHHLGLIEHAVRVGVIEQIHEGDPNFECRGKKGARVLEHDPGPVMGHSCREIPRDEHDFEVVLAVIEKVHFTRDYGGGWDDQCCGAQQHS